MDTSASPQKGRYSDIFPNSASMHLRRALSQLLIATLLLISPITFSTDKIPNFTYECPISTVCTIKTKRSVVYQRSPEVTLRQFPESGRNHGFPTEIAPPVALNCFDSPCRAPPA